MPAIVRSVFRAVALGFLSWLIPFIISLFLFRLKQSNAPLFTTVMSLLVLTVAGVLFAWYFNQRPVSLARATSVGLLWLAMNLMFDYPMFAVGPMKMTAAAYYSEIGLVYLTFPLFALFAAQLAKH